MVTIGQAGATKVEHRVGCKGLSHVKNHGVNYGTALHLRTGGCIVTA